MLSTWSSLVMLLALISVIAPLTFARSVRNQSGGSGRRRQGRGRQTINQQQQYYWVCPVVTCPPISETCQTIEYLVMEFEYLTDEGQRATVRCESCEYCLDITISSSVSSSSSSSSAQSSESQQSRAKRSSNHHRRHYDCSSISCPDLPSSCSDIRLADVFIGASRCKRCPACFDETVFNRT